MTHDRSLSPSLRAMEGALRAWGRLTPTSKGAYRLARRIAAATPKDLRRRCFHTPPAGEMRLDLDVYPDCCMAYGVYERETERVIRRVLRPGDHFIDVGANIGYFTLLAAGLVGETGQVDAFEPQPDNRARLVEHLRRNCVGDHVVVHPVAASDAKGLATIHWFPGDPAMNHGSSTLIDPKDRASRRATVETERLDHLLPEARPRLVKIDVEGSEPAVIRGIAGWLKEQPPRVLMEWSGGEGGFERVELLAAAMPRARWFVLDVWARRIKPVPADLQALGLVNLLVVPEGSDV